MATANSVTFQTDKNSLFASAINIVRDAGYIISETDDAARKIIYYADSVGKVFRPSRRFEVAITVSGSSETTATTAMLSMRVAGLSFQRWTGNHYETEIATDDEFEKDLIQFVMKELMALYQVAASETTIVNAPGAGGPKSEGCLVLLGFLGLLAAGCGFGCFTFWATLFP